MKKKVLITGSQGFIGSFLCQELLAAGYKVVGLDNFSKYGAIKRAHDIHPNFKLIEGDAKNLVAELFANSEQEYNFDYIIALAASIGGISYFHTFAYDLFSENEGIMKAIYDYSIKHHTVKPLNKVVTISSSMVYESTMSYPSFEGDTNVISAPFSSYGRQKLVCEWWAEAAFAQYKVPYSIVRPFNAVGIGEEKSIKEHDLTSGNTKMMLSHVLPDLIQKCLEGQNPLHILGEGNQIRCYTNGADIARGIRLAMEDTNVNQTYNISTPIATTVLELAEKVWNKINPNLPFEFVSDDAFLYDVQKRIPNVNKAKELLCFEAEISLDQSIDEVIEYMKARIAK